MIPSPILSSCVRAGPVAVVSVSVRSTVVIVLVVTLVTLPLCLHCVHQTLSSDIDSHEEDL